ncbi:hypothetical protein [Pseudomonas sp. M30-35]|uniref:hypothetical protein n=1 Tax=Pseudomonas sp. M30-35 TaxID=1981174 RepID=UPI000B3D2DF5|nr:hypothetical protein [Pseudomonas sp. M30-35]ARU87845.1 hypothetical protein B9K09_07640 [Pseudomonas sp. M30-35]
MAKKNILTIGFSVAEEDVEFSDFDSDMSLLDWDIILFKPDINDYIRRCVDTFEGRPCLSDDDSFKLKSQSEHWRREIKSAMDNGKLVIVFLSELTKLNIATGEKRFSGTGRNQQVTRIVTSYDNYHSIPLSLKPLIAKGKEIKLSAKNSEIISSYWSEFSAVSSYKVILDGECEPCLVTKHGDKVVGTIVRSKNSNGALVCLPDIEFYPDSFFVGEEDEENEGEFTEEAKQFSSKFIKYIVSLSKTLNSQGELTPEPDWAKSYNFKLELEKSEAQKLLKIEQKLEKVQAEKESVIDKVKDLERIRYLLFEKGKPLEYAILDALRTIGFEVSQFNDGESEFDAVFESKEGRLIGEVEGKDNKAINIDKLRQLALNIYEDLEREEVEVSAKPVLFGNAYRLLPVESRAAPFTSKCLSAAIISSTALVSTPDLFVVVKYLKDNKDIRFATKCRKAILDSVGLVDFPEIPRRGSVLSKQERGSSAI